MNLRFFASLSLFVTLCNGYKILFLAPMNGKSHFMYMQSFVRTLLDRGHEVTFLTSNTLKHFNLANYTEVLVDPPLDILNLMPNDAFLKMAEGNVFTGISELYKFSRAWNPYAYENPNVQKFIHTDGLHFDLVINEEFFADSLLMFAHKYNAPIVSISPFGMAEYIDRQQGLLQSPSFVPHWLMPFTDEMTFFERWLNSIVTAYDWIVRRFVFLPTEEEYAKKYFGHLAPLPSIDDLHRNVSLFLVNTHRALSPPRPSMPNVINIGGAHIKPVKPLPKDLKTFLDESRHGVIFFSLGTAVESSKLPKELLKSILDTFKNLKQRVLWKFEDESLGDIPSNVMIRKWMPQNDILAHPNVVLFISHGGLCGTSESLYHGVPLLLIPFFGDQIRNSYRILAAGYGTVIHFTEITQTSFTNAITGIISNESYIHKAKEMSAIYRDNLVSPMDEAMYWIEHVCKFRGAKHLKSHAVNISWISYLLLDVLIVNVLCVLVVLYILYHLIKKLFAKKKSNLSKNKKQK